MKNINIESIKSYIGTTKQSKFDELAAKIYMLTEFICEDYPNHKEWYFNKQLKETIIDDERNILFVRNPKKYNEIIAVACLKRTLEEQKICTIYVKEKYRRKGIGTALINESMNWLGTTKPLITIADYKLEMFKPFINKYDWKLTEIVSGLYNGKNNELCFNGYLINFHNSRFNEGKRPYQKIN